MDAERQLDAGFGADSGKYGNVWVQTSVQEPLAPGCIHPMFPCVPVACELCYSHVSDLLSTCRCILRVAFTALGVVICVAPLGSWSSLFHASRLLLRMHPCPPTPCLSCPRPARMDRKFERNEATYLSHHATFLPAHRPSRAPSSGLCLPLQPCPPTPRASCPRPARLDHTSRDPKSKPPQSLQVYLRIAAAQRIGSYHRG